MRSRARRWAPAPRTRRARAAARRTRGDGGAGARQALLSRFLNLPIVEVDLLSEGAWLAAGLLCGKAGTSDVVDAAVVACAHRRTAHAVITSDPGELRRLDPNLTYWSP